MAWGTCHVCAIRDKLPLVLQVFAGRRGRDHQEVRHCPRCGHWLCQECWGNVMGRLGGFIDTHIGKPREGCCGPQKKAQEDA